MAASLADGPSPVGDAIGFLGALLILAAGAFQIAFAPVMPVTAIPRSEVKEETKAQTLEVAPTLPNKKDDIVIYRYGGTNPGNLVPRERDVNGLSFSTEPPKDGIAGATTMGAVNATGILVAVRDKPKHVSVRPRFASIAIWRNLGATSPFTLALKAILVQYRGGRSNER